MEKYLLPSNKFFICLQLLSAVALVYAIIMQSSYEWWLLSAFGYFLITCVGVTVTFHRLLAHKSYKLWKPLEYLFSFFGNLGCTGSSIGWTFVHRTHHRYTDKPGDPHSPVIFGALGAMRGDYSAEFNKWMVKDLVVDPVHKFMHMYYVPMILSVIILTWLIDPALMVHLFFIPVLLNTLASRMSNWIDHSKMFGTKPADWDKDESHNVWWWSLLTFGEGWHNNHHARPGDYRIGRTWWQFDPGRYVIESLIFSGLASRT